MRDVELDNGLRAVAPCPACHPEKVGADRATPSDTQAEPASPPRHTVPPNDAMRRARAEKRARDGDLHRQRTHATTSTGRTPHSTRS